MEGIIDRFEGEYAVVEAEGKMLNIPAALLPREAKEGDVITIAITVNKKKTAAVKKQIEDLADKVWEE